MSATITASMVKELRDRTGAGMMECKKALVEANGDIEVALDELRKRGTVKAEKKAGRATKEGLIFAKVEGDAAVMVELSCETDFVARNDDFLAFGRQLADLAMAQGIGSAEALLAATIDGKSVKDTLTDKIATIGENMGVNRVALVKAEGGLVTSYIHPPGKLGVIVRLNTSKAGDSAIEQLGKDLAMHVAAAGPLSIKAEDMDADVVAREREIYLGQMQESGKPEKMWDKIVDGKMQKFFKDSCLLQQEFIKDNELSVQQLIAKVGKDAGDDVSIVSFTRFLVGEGVEDAGESAE